MSLMMAGIVVFMAIHIVPTRVALREKLTRQWGYWVTRACSA